MKSHAFFQIVFFMTVFTTCSALNVEKQVPSDQSHESNAEEADDDDQDQVGTWIGGKCGRCFFSDDDFIYPNPNFIEDMNRETDTWPGKREDPFYDNLTR